MSVPETNTAESSVRPKRRPVWRRITAVVLVSYVVVLTAMLMLESYLVFPGASKPNDLKDWQSSPSTATPFDYPSTDDVTITGQLVRHDGGGYIIYFHGNGNKAIWNRGFIQRLSDATSCTVLAAEYRGYNEDGHRPSERKLVDDSLAAVDAMCDEFNIAPDDIIVYGSSLGGGCAAAVAQHRPVAGVILERSFDRLVDVAAGMYPFLPVRWLMKTRFDSVERLKDFDGPILQLHGDNDGIVPIKHARNLESELTTTRRHFIEIKDWDHNDPVDDNLLHRIALWIQSTRQSSRHR
ncbi:alpha/beta hydrolase [Crateriforma spongiae]|uniref:alpha/beta hydrolase n=1 Tax=Crateriforma spongiae TaxID=2724528 RepID=UPI0014473389|nr:alpha/beta hydrolase [Crateriforma spongiae]